MSLPENQTTIATGASGQGNITDSTLVGNMTITNANQVTIGASNSDSTSQMIEGDENCSVCNSLGETTQAVLWCSECEMSFCKGCSQQHTVIPSTKNHHLDKVNAKSKRKKSLKKECPQHKELMTFYCRDCNKSICGICGTFQHKKCGDIVTLESMMDDTKSSIPQSHQAARTEGDMIPWLEDITVMTVGDVEAVIVTDGNNCSVKCFYNSSYSVCQLKGNTCGIANMKDNRVMVALPYKRQLVTLHVTPVLIKLKITKTKAQYFSLDMMDNGQLVAGAESGSVDVLDVSGNTASLIKTLRTDVFGATSLGYHGYLTVSRHETHTILVSDNNRRLTCMTLEGDIRWTYSPPRRTLFEPLGVTTTQGGDVIVVDGHTHNIIVITRSGKYKSDLLTPADGAFTFPRAVHYDDRGYLYVADSDRILTYKFPKM